VVIGAELALICALALQSSPTVTVVTDWPVQEVRVMKVEEAERLLATTSDPKLRASLILALGTRITAPEPHGLTAREFERARWRRLPLQRLVLNR